MQSDLLRNYLIQVGKNIKEKRKLRKMTMEALGLEVGLTRMHIHRIEKGYNITLATLLKLSIALDIKSSELLKYDMFFKKEDLEKLVNSSKATK